MASSSTTVPKLFQSQPLGLGAPRTGINLKHRVVLSPLTRFRNNAEHVPTDLVRQYYEQRSRTPGTLLVTDATFIAKKAGGVDNSPGIYTEEQIQAWTKVVDAVHANGSYIFLQLWALGRAARPDALAKEGNLDYVAPSAIGLKGSTATPRELTTDEVKGYVQLYAQAAANAVEGAGFDGVEIHGANGYLVDQFIQDFSNQRTDAYGGSIEKRAKFALDIVDAVSARIGAPRTAIRLSPWSEYQDMGMADPVPQFRYIVEQLKSRQPDLAYLHMIEPAQSDVGQVVRPEPTLVPSKSNDFARTIWKERGGAFISAGEYDPERAVKHAEKTGDLVAFGRWFISNPNLPRRIREKIPLTPYDTNTFYTRESPKGYIDYPFEPSQTVKAPVQISSH